MKKFFFKIKGRQYDVEVQEYEDNIAKVDVNGTVYEVEVENNKPVSKTPTLVRKRVENKPGDAKIKSTGGSGSSSIKAPLPGNIIKINVKEGDTVKAGDTIMVMEAMKMENNIQADSEGTIATIKVAVGDAVMQDDVLVEIK